MRLVILGAESLGREALEVALKGGYEDIVFLDDAAATNSVDGCSVIGGFT